LCEISDTCCPAAGGGRFIVCDQKREVNDYEMMLFSRDSAANGGCKARASSRGRSRGTLAQALPPSAASDIAPHATAATGVAAIFRRRKDPATLQTAANNHGGGAGSCRPHSWHSTLQRGFLHRARSRSSGRGETKDQKSAKRASAASLVLDGTMTQLA
jgi:hypothetical protein